MKKTALIFIMMVSFLGLAKAQNHHWTPIGGNQYTMTVKGLIYIDGVYQDRSDLEIAAFCGDQCRASTFPGNYFPPAGGRLVNMDIQSNLASGETITFKLYDHAINEELNLEGPELDYEANAIIGGVGNWYEFAFTTPSIHNTVAGNWDNASIWAGGAVPGTGAAVVIDYDCVVDINAEVASLTVTSGNTLTINKGIRLTVTNTLVSDDESGILIKDGGELINSSSDVKATAEKDVTEYTSDSNGWHLISSPVDEMSIAGSQFIVEIYDLYRYKEAGSVWENYRNHPEFNRFENGRGYLYANSSTFSPVFHGTLNQSSMIYNVTYTTSNTSLKGVNVIGNPFPHKIYKGEGGAIDDSRLASGYYILTYEGEWKAQPFDKPIQPNQGILVFATETFDLGFSKTAAAAVNESGSSKAPASRLGITVTGDNSEDCAYVYFTEGIGLEKMEHMTPSMPSLGINNEGTTYAIAHMNPQTESINLVFSNSRSGEYTMTFEMLNLDFDYLRLIDNDTGEEIDILTEPEYTFHANGSEPDNRFTISMKNVTGIGEEYSHEVFAWTSSNGIMVNGDGMLEIYDVTGRRVYSAEVSGITEVNTVTTAGVYILRLVNEEGNHTQKTVIR